MESSQQQHSDSSGQLGAMMEPLNSILKRAIAERATDVHIDPIENGKTVRYRVDGIIHVKSPIEWRDRMKVLNQVKISANFSIDKSFMPQEGLISLPHEGKTQDIRVTVTPVGNRTAIHFRFLSASQFSHSLGDLGMAPDSIESIRTMLRAPSGLVLIVGSTGSGKSTSMYALANAVDLKTKVAVSIEDPVEFRIPLIRQLQVDEFHGLTMSEGLRAILRMDPDVILVGEIRDQQSAVTASRAALAGRLVLATLHAPDAATAVDALQNLSVPPYVIGGALRMILRQDLVRLVCGHCATHEPITDEQRAMFERHGVRPPVQVAVAGECMRCKGYGYLGRTGVFELSRIDKQLGRDISAGLHRGELEDCFRRAVQRTLIADALRKAAAGETTVQEARHLVLALQEE